MYHAESSQEDFLVLAGTCLLIVEEEERELRAWDFVHCPPGTRHTFVGTGDEPCVIFMTGARQEDGTIVYPRLGGGEGARRGRGDRDEPARARRTRRSATGASAGPALGLDCPGAGMTVKRMDNVGIVVESLDAAIAFFAELGLSSKGEPRSKESGPGASPDWATSASRSP